MTGDKDGHVAVTDEEESGSSTSSAEDPECRTAADDISAAPCGAPQRKDSESTASAPSPFAAATNGTPNGEPMPAAGGDEDGLVAATLAAPSPLPTAVTANNDNNDKGDSSATVSAPCADASVVTLRVV